MNLAHRLVGVHVSNGFGDRVAYVDLEVEKLTYADLYRMARAYAGALRDLGVPPGARGVVAGDDTAATAVAVLGLWWYGCVAVPVSPMLTAEDISFVMRDCDAQVIHLDLPAAKAAALGAHFPQLPKVDGARVREAIRSGQSYRIGSPVEGEPADFPSDSEVLIQYTSGSTGTPKGVRHSLAGVLGVLEGFGAVLGLRPDDAMMSTAKLSFGYGFGNSLLFALGAGARAVLLGGALDAYLVAAAVRRHRPTVLCAVPRVYAGLLDLSAAGRGVDLDSVRTAVSAGEHLPADIALRFADTFGLSPLNGLGATEVLHIVLATRPRPEDAGSTGRAVPGVTATVRDDAGRPVPDGTQGRLHIAGPSVALGYLGRPAETAATFADGGAYTGDIVCRDANGAFSYVGRADDMLNVGGFKVSPAEIESVIRRADGARECAVVGGVDRHGLEAAVAFVVAADGVDHGELRSAVRASLRAQLPAFKHPGRIEVVEQLPVTANGKLARSKLRRQLEYR